MALLLIDDFLTNEECKKFIVEINFKRSKIPFTNSSNADTDKYDDLQLANKFYDKVKLHNISEIFPDLCGVNKTIMTSKYIPGTMFGIHTDTGIYYSRKDGICSKYTLLTYLNDDFIGGETVFYDNNFKEFKRITPKQGSCLIFDMQIFHCGLAVENGTKYWIGCELLGKIN